MYRSRHIPVRFPRYTDAKDIKREIEEIKQRIESNTMMNMDIQNNVIAEIDRLRQDNMDMAAILGKEEIFYGHTNIYEEVTRLRCMNLRLKATMDLQQMDDISKMLNKPCLSPRPTQVESEKAKMDKQQMSGVSKRCNKSCLGDKATCSQADSAKAPTDQQQINDVSKRCNQPCLGATPLHAESTKATLGQRQTSKRYIKSCFGARTTQAYSTKAAMNPQQMSAVSNRCTKPCFSPKPLHAESAKATLDQQQTGDIIKSYNKPCVGDRAIQAESTYNGSYKHPYNQEKSRVSTEVANYIEPDHPTRWEINDSASSDDKDSNMNSVTESPSETGEILFIVRPTKSPSGNVVTYDLPEDVTGMDLYGRLDQRNIRVHVEPIQLLHEEDIPCHISIEDVEIREIYSSKSSDMSTGISIEHESSLAVTDIPKDEDSHLNIPFERVPPSEQERVYIGSKLDDRCMVSESDFTWINQGPEQDLATIVEQHRYADYIESCKTTMHLCSVIIEMCANKIGNPGQEPHTQNVPNGDKGQLKKVSEARTDVSVNYNETLDLQRPWEDNTNPKKAMARENEPMESSSLEVTDIIEDVIGDRHLPIPFKLIPYGHWRPKCVPKLDLTGLASESDVDVAKISGHDIQWLFPLPNHRNGIEEISHHQAFPHHEVCSSKKSGVQTVSPTKEHTDGDRNPDIPFKLVSSSDQERPRDVSKLDLKGMVSDSDINIARVDENTAPQVAADVENQRYADYIESCKTTIQLCNIIIEMCTDKIGSSGKDSQNKKLSHVDKPKCPTHVSETNRNIRIHDSGSRVQKSYKEAQVPEEAMPNEPNESSSLEVTEIIEDVIGDRHLPIPFKLIPYGHWRPKCVPKLDLRGLASESDVDVAKISGHDIQWLFPLPNHGNDVQEMPHQRTSQHQEIYSSRHSGIPTVSAAKEHKSLVEATDIPKDGDRNPDTPFKLVSSSDQERPRDVSKLDRKGMVSDSDINIVRVDENTAPKLAADVEDQRYADYIGSCKTTIQLCNIIIEMCTDKINSSRKDSRTQKFPHVDKANSYTLEYSDLSALNLIKHKLELAIDLLNDQASHLDIPKIILLPEKERSKLENDRPGVISNLDLRDGIGKVSASDKNNPQMDQNTAELSADIENQRYAEYIESCKTTIQLCNTFIEKCTEKMSNSEKVLKKSPMDTNGSQKKRIKSVTSGNKDDIDRPRVHFREVDSIISDHGYDDKDDVPCIDLSIEVPSIRPVKEGHVVKEFLSSDEDSPRDTTLDCTPELPLAEIGNNNLMNDLPGGPQLVESEFVDDVGRLDLNMSANNEDNTCFQGKALYHISKIPGGGNIKSR